MAKLDYTGSQPEVIENVYFAGQLWMQGMDSTQVGVNLLKVDRLGPVRGTMFNYPYNPTPNSSYLPFGEELTHTVGDRDKFATYTRDSATGLDYANQRYYASAYGRFLTPDPYRKSADINKPSSWNRYAYVNNDPANRKDKRGLNEDGCDGEGEEDCCGYEEECLVGGDGGGGQTGSGTGQTGNGGGGGNSVQAGIDAVKKALTYKEKCDSLIAGDSRANGSDDLIGALKDAGVTTDNLGAATVAANAGNTTVSYRLGNTTNGGIVLNNNFFPNANAQAIQIGSQTKSILDVFNQSYGTNLTSVQLEALTIFHELSHLLGRADDSKNSDATRQFNIDIIRNYLN